MFENIKTPFYVYNAKNIKEQYYLLSDAIGNGADVFYSLKANPNIAISQYLQVLGAGAEVCSEVELYAALKAGFKPKNIIFVGPAKSDEVITLCLEKRIYAIICESINEFNRIGKIANQLKIIAPVALRINPDFITKNALLKMGGKPSQFGMDEFFVFEQGEYFKINPAIKLIGIQVYNGTRILDAQSIVDNTQAIFKLAERFSEKFNVHLELVDIGGGLGVPYFQDEREINIEELKYKLAHVIKQFSIAHPTTRIILESGRFLVAESGRFVSSVIDIKESKGEMFVVTDGGTNCHMAAVGIGSVIKRNFPIHLIQRNKSISHIATNLYNITGPLCTPGDVIGKSVLLPPVNVGDLVVIERSGAYGPTASPTLFLSHGHPAEYFIEDNQLRLIRSADDSEDFFRKQIY